MKYVSQVDRDLGFSDKKLSRIIESIGFRLLEADKSRFIKPLYSQYQSLSPFELDEMLDFFKKHNEVKVDWNQKDKENLFLDLINIMNDTYKKSEQKNEEKKYYRQDNAKELLSSNPEFVVINELENDEWVFACPRSYKGARFADSSECGGSGAKWCIGYEKSDDYWNEYIKNGSSFVFALRKDFKIHQDKDDIKYMIEILPDNRFNVWNQPDNAIIRNNKDRFESLFGVESEILIDFGKEVFDNNFKDGYGYEMDGDTLIVIDNDFKIPKRKQFSKVIISDGVTSISNSAFSSCEDLKSIIIPNSVTKIGVCAFEGCRNLMSVTIPNSVTEIGNGAFRVCRGLTSIAIPDNVTSMGAEVFQYCEELTSIEIPDSITSIGNYAFSGCRNLKKVIIGNSVTSIGNSAFKGCMNLMIIEIPDSVTSIGKNAFEGCYILMSVTIPDNVTSIGDGAFYGCSGLTNITIPSRVTSIGAELFQDCDGLTSVEIPDSVISIGSYAFGDCSELTSIEIPDSVTNIRGYAFNKCKRLITLTIKAQVPPHCFSNMLRRCDSLESIFVPKESVEDYKSAEGWSQFANIIKGI